MDKDKEIEKLKEKIKVINTKYKSKYMQLEHERRQWQVAKDNLLEIISKLKVELIKYVSDSELYEMADKITSICNSKHIGTKKSLKIQK